MTSAKRVVARFKEVIVRYKAATKLRLGPPVVETRATEGLRRATLKARNQGDLQSAVLSAGYYAKKQNRTMYIYSGNSHMHLIWRVSDKPGEYLNPINNTGGIVYSVTPELEVSRQEVLRDQTKEAVIRKEKGEFCVRSPENPDWNGGCYPSEGKAERRLEQVEYFKHKNAGMIPTHVVEVYTSSSGSETVKTILERIDKLGAPGHSFGIKSDDGVDLGGWDGDGSDHIQEIRIREL